MLNIINYTFFNNIGIIDENCLLYLVLLMRCNEHLRYYCTMLYNNGSAIKSYPFFILLTTTANQNFRSSFDILIIIRGFFILIFFISSFAVCQVMLQWQRMRLNHMSRGSDSILSWWGMSLPPCSRMPQQQRLHMRRKWSAFLWPTSLPLR